MHLSYPFDQPLNLGFLNIMIALCSNVQVVVTIMLARISRLQYVRSMRNTQLRLRIHYWVIDRDLQRKPLVNKDSK